MCTDQSESGMIPLLPLPQGSGSSPKDAVVIIHLFPLFVRTSSAPRLDELFKIRTPVTFSSHSSQKLHNLSEPFFFFFSEMHQSTPWEDYEECGISFPSWFLFISDLILLLKIHILVRSPVTSLKWLNQTNLAAEGCEAWLLDCVLKDSCGDELCFHWVIHWQS